MADLFSTDPGNLVLLNLSVAHCSERCSGKKWPVKWPSEPPRRCKEAESSGFSPCDLEVT